MGKEEVKLKAMRAELDAKKEKTAELRGERQSITKQLKAKGCDSIAEAKKTITSENKKAESLREKLKDGLDELEQGYEWEEI